VENLPVVFLGPVVSKLPRHEIVPSYTNFGSRKIMQAIHDR